MVVVAAGGAGKRRRVSYREPIWSGASAHLILYPPLLMMSTEVRPRMRYVPSAYAVVSPVLNQPSANASRVASSLFQYLKSAESSVWMRHLQSGLHAVPFFSLRNWETETHDRVRNRSERGRRPHGEWGRGKRKERDPLVFRPSSAFPARLCLSLAPVSQ